MSDEDFILLPLVLPDDAPALALLHYNIFYVSDPDYADERMPFEEFAKSREPRITERLTGPDKLMAKFVRKDEPGKVVSYIVFSPPKPVDGRTDEEKDADLRAELERYPPWGDKELTFRLKNEDRVLQERFFGKGYESRFWELSALVTDEKHQRRGFGSRLVQWGVEQVEKEIKKSEGKVEGCCLIASLAGRRTYTKAGFEMVGERPGIEGLKEKHQHAYFVKTFS